MRLKELKHCQQVCVSTLSIIKIIQRQHECAAQTEEY